MVLHEPSMFLIANAVILLASTETLYNVQLPGLDKSCLTEWLVCRVSRATGNHGKRKRERKTGKGRQVETLSWTVATTAVS